MGNNRFYGNYQGTTICNHKQGHSVIVNHLNSEDINAETQHVNVISHMYPHPFGANVGCENKSTVIYTRNWSRPDHKSNGFNCNKSKDPGNGQPHE
eukprot:9811550-Heterocapsa_arctica.AAC.1